MNWSEIITIFVGTGIISTIAQSILTSKLNKNQLLFSAEINKRFFRFSNLYKDKLDIIRELYKLLIKAECGLQILMTSSPPELKVNSDGNETDEYKMEKAEFRKTTTDAISIFFSYFEENEIVFENEIAKYVKELDDKFREAIKSHSHASIMESSRPSKGWEDAVQGKQDTYDTIVKKDIPCLKGELKKTFQDRYKLLETN